MRIKNNEIMNFHFSLFFIIKEIFMSRIKVLHVAEAAGGVERYLETLFKYNDNSKVENILVCSQNYDYKRLKKLTHKITILQMEHEVSPIKDITVERKLRNIIKKEKPDIVYAHSTKAGAFARIANLGINNKLIYNPHGWAFNMQQSSRKRQMYKWFEKISSNFCDKIICISNSEKKSALREGICKASKLEVISNGIDIEKLKRVEKSARSLNRIPTNAFVIGQVGRLSKQKAPDIFVRAAELIKKKISNSYFIMVGDGELRDDIEKLIRDKKLENSFLITGWVDNPSEYMKVMDVGTLFSRWEGFGLVLPEYMLCKVPVVATRVDAIPNIIKDSVNGLLVNCDNYREAASAIENLYEDKKLKNNLVRNGYRIAIQNFDGKEMSAKVEQLYMNLIKRENI